ncbi:MAG: S8 family serine peptidase [Bacteroidales bacterium]|nr:S8 family serine peptidase [Bacteroidales bacterium]
MKKMYSIILILLTFFGSDQLQAQQYKVVRGERPPIDYSKVTQNDYVKGVLKIKLEDHVSWCFTDLQVTKNSLGVVGFGIASLDALNREYAATEVKHDFAVISAASAYVDRHIAWGFHLWYTLQFDENTDMVKLAGLYASLPEVAIAEPEFKKALIGNAPPRDGDIPEDFNPAEPSAFWTPNDPRYNEQWHYHNTGQQGGTPDADIDLPEAWEMEKGNPNVIVAIIDEGIQYNHPDLQANMWEGIGFNFYNNSPNINPGNHGTHVGGTISAVNNNGVGVSGVAGGSGAEGNGVRLMSCQVFSGFSSGGFAQAPVWAADQGASISQNSWGYTSAGNYNQDVLDAIDYFSENGGGDAMIGGGITIFAAGNSNADGAWYPGYYPVTMAVAGTNNQDRKAWYSNFGTWVDISAPGGETNQSNPKGVLSSLNGSSYGFYEGTSMACPHVSGVAALIISKAYGTLTPDELWDVLVTTTDDHYGVNPGFIGKLGSGRVNAYNALASLKDIQDPYGLTAVINQETGISVLNWSHNQGSGFEYYKVYLDGVFIDNTVSKTFQHLLTDYGYYTFEVTAFYGGTDESNPAVKEVQFGSSNMVLSDSEVNVELYLGESEVRDFKIWNTGVLPLEYTLSTFGMLSPDQNWFVYDPSEGTVAVGDSAIIALTFNAEGLELGTYTRNFIVRSNDLNNAVKSVPVSLTVIERQPMQVTVDISATEICVGETIQLSVEAIDGTGEYTYSWTSDPEGFVSDEQYPQHTPEVATTYFIIVSDGVDEISNEVSVAVYPLPVVALSADQEFCGEQSVLLDAGNEGLSYLWSTGETTQTIEVSQAEYGFGSHEFWVTVTGPIGCSDADTTKVSYYEFPAVAQLGPDTLLCGNENWVLEPSITGYDMLWSNGETSSSITVDTLGFGYGVQTYWVDLTSAEGCTTRSEEVVIEFLDCTGLNELKQGLQLSAYPNPTNDNFEVFVASLRSGNAELQLINAMGMVVFVRQIETNQPVSINPGDMPEGIYTLLVKQNGVRGHLKLLIR